MKNLIKNTHIQISRSLDGASPRDCMIGFLAARYTSLKRSRKRLRDVLRRLMVMFAEDGLIHANWTISGRLVRITFRADNQADHCVFAELVMQGGYQFRPESPPSCIIDGGANIGLFAIASYARFPHASIRCFEIDDANLKLLRRNLHDNDIPAEIIPKALWATTGMLFYHPSTSYTGYVSPEPSAFPMECMLPDVPADCWMKLDIEGAEYEVLPAILGRQACPKVISIEIHDFANRGPGLLDLLKEHGYTWHEVFSNEESCVTLNAELDGSPPGTAL